MDELQRVAEAHRGDVRVLVEGVDHVDVLVPLLGLLGLQELAHPEALPRRPVHLERRRPLHHEAHEVEVDDEDLHGVLGARHDDAVDEAELGRHAGRALPDHGLRHQDLDAIDGGGALHSLGDAHVGREVGGVDLELAAHGALDGPAVVDAAAQVHAALSAHLLLQPRVAAVGGEHRRAVHGPEDGHEGQHGHVRHLADLLRLLVRGPPDREEGVARVLVRRPVVLVHHPVHDLRDLVHEAHDLRLEHLRGDAEVLDPAAADDALHPRALHHHNDVGALGSPQVVRDDVGPGLAEAEGQ
mmetsp:Transcript_33110/g.95178  ORF Transcript_33110/g.95178 Transcript_33110/m.95178 type:complete len:299 (-) Transcript_33110:1661-2557(-)